MSTGPHGAAELAPEQRPAERPSGLAVGYSLATLVPGYMGGIESYARGLLGALAGLEREVVDLRVLANPLVLRSYGRFEGDNVSLAQVTGDRYSHVEARRLAAMLSMRVRARAIARRHLQDLDVVHHVLTVPLPHVDVRRVATLQDVQHLEHPEFFSRAERLYRRWAYDRSAATATEVITASDHAKAGIVERVGVPAERIHIAPHGIDHTRFRPGPVDDDEQALDGLAPPERFIVYPANLWPHKNHERLLEALALAQDKDLGLVLTGQTYGRLDALMQHAGRLGVTHRVQHLGHVAAPAIPALYRRATALIFPSLFEGFGIPLTEAMACGCPVATSSRASLPEVTADAGLVFDPTDPSAIADAIDRLSSDGELRDELSSRGRARARGFTWERCASLHLAVYQRAAR